MTLSTGEKIQHPQPLKQSLNKLQSLNKDLSRKVKGSNGWWGFERPAIETLNLDGMKRLWGRKVSDLFYQFTVYP